MILSAVDAQPAVVSIHPGEATIQESKPTLNGNPVPSLASLALEAQVAQNGHLNEECIGYTVRESPMGTKRKLKIIFMGMGCSGINFAHHLRRQMTDVELVVYEKNNDIG